MPPTKTRIWSRSFPSTSSRSAAPSCRAWAATIERSTTSARWSARRAAAASRRSPSASKTRRRGTASSSSDSLVRRATSSRRRCLLLNSVDGERRACDPGALRARVLSRGRSVSSAGVLFARPLVGSRWTADQGPLAQKTPTLLNLPPRAARGALTLIALLLCSCAGPAASSPSSSVTTIPIPTTAPPPTPTASPRIGPAVVQNVQLVASGLRAPWAVDLAPDGRLFVTERPGRVRIVQLGPGGGLQPDSWATVPASTSIDGERGLLGIALDP